MEPIPFLQEGSSASVDFSPAVSFNSPCSPPFSSYSSTLLSHAPHIPPGSSSLPLASPPLPSSNPSTPLPAPQKVDNEPEWVVYPQANYEFNNIGELKDKLLESDQKIIKRLNTYHKEGVRRSVCAILLTHRHETPHVLLLQHIDTQKFCLFSAKYKSWEKPRDVLKEKLKQYVKRIDDKSKFLSAHKLLNTQPTDDIEVGEFLGMWWRTEFYADPLPYLPPHVTRPKERIRLYQVTLATKCLFSIPVGYSLKALPLFDLDAALYGLAIGGIAHLLSRFKIHRMVEGEIETFDTSSSSSSGYLFSASSSSFSSLAPSSSAASYAASSSAASTAFSSTAYSASSCNDKEASDTSKYQEVTLERQHSASFSSSFPPPAVEDSSSTYIFENRSGQNGGGDHHEDERGYENRSGGATALGSSVHTET